MCRSLRRQKLFALNLGADVGPDPLYLTDSEYACKLLSAKFYHLDVMQNTT